MGFLFLAVLVSIHQPEFIGYLGYYAKILRAERHVVLDDVQFIKRGFIQRNTIRCGDEAHYLTVPVKTKGRYTQRIMDVEIDQSYPWRKKLLGSLRTCYARAPHFEPIFTAVTELFEGEWRYIADLNCAWLELVLGLLGERRPIVRSSSFAVGGEKCERLCNLVKAVGGDSYLSGNGARVYNDEQVFKQRGVELLYTAFTHPSYSQLGAGYIERLCILDALFNCEIRDIKVWLHNEI